MEGRRLKRFGTIFLWTCLAGLSACSPIDLLNLAAPTERTEAARGIPFAQGERQRLDVYRPSAAANSPSAVVVFFYGGRWSAGERADYAFVGATLAAHGVVTVIPDYRLHPEVSFPAFVEDGAAAVRWTQANIARFGGDPGRIYLMGHSAGAHIAALLALDPRFLAARGPVSGLAGLIGIAGPYDFLPLEADDLRTIFGPPERFPLSQPIVHARGDAPPMLLLHGLDDRIVEPGNSRRLAAAVRDRGGHAETVLYPDISHAEILGAIADPLDFLAPVRADILSFVARAERAVAERAHGRIVAERIVQQNGGLVSDRFIEISPRHEPGCLGAQQGWPTVQTPHTHGQDNPFASSIPLARGHMNE